MTENGGKIRTRPFWASVALTLLRFYSGLKQSEFAGLAMVTAPQCCTSCGAPQALHCLCSSEHTRELICCGDLLENYLGFGQLSALYCLIM